MSYHLMSWSKLAPFSGKISFMYLFYLIRGEYFKGKVSLRIWHRIKSSGNFRVRKQWLKNSNRLKTNVFPLKIYYTHILFFLPWSGAADIALKVSYWESFFVLTPPRFHLVRSGERCYKSFWGATDICRCHQPFLRGFQSQWSQ